MKVLYFHQYFITQDGFGGTRSFEMAKHLVGNGYSVTMVYIRSNGAKALINKPFCKGVRRGEFEGIQLIEFDIPYSNKFRFVKRTFVFLQYAYRCSMLAFSESYDLLFASSTPLTAGIPGIIMKWFARKKRPFVFEVRDLWPELPKAMGVISSPIVLRLMDILETLSYRAADACIGLSPGIQEGIKRKVNNDKPVILIPNGCDLKLFKPGSKVSSNAEHIKKPIKAIFTGAHGLANGLDSVLNAANVLLKRGFEKEISIFLIGDGMEKERLIKRSEMEGLKNCTFLQPVSKLELASILPEFDVGLMVLKNVPAFYYGTSPNKFFDYISSGIPVLNNYPGWLSDLIAEYDCGIHVTPENPISFADALIDFYRFPKMRVEMGEKARKLAEEFFDRKKLAGTFEQVLRSCVKDWQDSEHNPLPANN